MGTHMMEWVKGIKIQDGELQQRPANYLKKKKKEMTELKKSLNEIKNSI